VEDHGETGNRILRKEQELGCLIREEKNINHNESNNKYLTVYAYSS
jgi:hypothetical protein